MLSNYRNSVKAESIRQVSQKLATKPKLVLLLFSIRGINPCCHSFPQILIQYLLKKEKILREDDEASKKELKSCSTNEAVFGTSMVKQNTCFIVPP